MTDPQQPGFGGPQQPMSKKDAKAQAAAAKAYSKSQRSWFAKHKILTALGALILLGVIISATSGGGGGGTDSVNTAGSDTTADTEAPAAQAPAAKAPAKPAEPAITVSAKELIAALEGNALKAKNTYNGKQVIVSGFVGSIDASGDYFALDPEPDALIFTGVQARISDKFGDQVANFEKGQAVTVTGKITDVGEVLGYQLKVETIK